MPKTGDLVVAASARRHRPHRRLVALVDDRRAVSGFGETAAILAEGPHTLAAICNGGAQMNHDPKAFAVSTDGGRSWHVRSAWSKVEVARSLRPADLRLHERRRRTRWHYYMATNR